MTSRPARAQHEHRESSAPSDRLILIAVGASALWVAGWIGIQLAGRLG